MRKKPLKGKLIVIEGTDGTGKATQFRILVKRLKRLGFQIRTFDFPRYGKPSCYFIERYLRGAYGTVKEVGPRKASLFYALERFDVSIFIKKALAEGKIVVMNRYVASNMGHQGSKILDIRARRKFFK